MIAETTIPPPPLKIGLIIDSPHVSVYVHELACWAQQQTQLVVSHVIIQHMPTGAQGKCARLAQMLRKKGLLHVAAAIGFECIGKLEALRLSRLPQHREHCTSYDIRTLVAESLTVTPLRSASGLVYRYRDEDIAAIKALGLDVLIRCGSGILRGEILRATPFGILSFHHADNRINRGIPPGFWEVFYKQDATGFIIQQLTEELDGGKVLMRGNFATRIYYLLNQAELLRKSNPYLMQLLERLASTRTLPAPLESLPYAHPLHTLPALGVQLRYGMYLVTMALRHLLSHHILQIKERWGVAYQRSDWRHLVMWRAKRIPNPRGHFLADPFVVEHQGQHYCFVEDYDDQKAKGAIAVYRLDDQGAQRLGIALEAPFHLSFPYLFQYQSQWYMCPESCEKKHIQLYQCEEFPLRWKPAATPMRNVAAADTLLIEKNGRWWMLTTMDPANTQDYCTQLSIFYADHPLSENWIPHARNPVYVDALQGRNGGIVSDGDRLYRIAQRQGFTGYGQAFSIREIVTLTPELFVEKEVTTIQPRFFSSLYGTHHLHSNGTYCVFDFLERKRG